MRRKREKGATTKPKPSPENKVEKVRRTRSRRRKQSSSENDTGDEIVQAPEVVSGTVQNVEETPVKENSPEDSQDQVWQVKTAEGSGDGEIQKLKICLTRPPSTPESCERSPRSKRRHTRATSLSDSASIEGLDEKKKTRHRAKRSMCESSETVEKQSDKQPTELEQVPELTEPVSEKVQDQVTEQETEPVTEPEAKQVNEPETEQVNEPETEQVNEPVTEPATEPEAKQVNEPEIEQVIEPEAEQVIDKVTECVTDKITEPVTESITETVTEQVTEKVTEPVVEQVTEKVTEPVLEPVTDLVTEVQPVAPAEVPKTDSNVDDQDSSSNIPEPSSIEKMDVEETVATEVPTSSVSETAVIEDSPTESKPSREDLIIDKEDDTNVSTEKATSPARERSMSIDKSEILEIHADESRIEISEPETSVSNIEQVEKTDKGDKKEDQESNGGAHHIEEDKVSINEDKAEENVVESSKSPQNEIISTNETDVVAITENSSNKEIDNNTLADEKKPIENSEAAQSSNEETVHNGHSNIVINRKRRWGSRPSRLTSQKSITISTDILKEIIPDVKPVEFEEVIEDKKHHKRVEITEKIERPVLPKIVIDNTANIDLKREKEQEVTDSVQHKDVTTLASNRKISIVKETDSPTIRPPSPPRGEQSNILFITNLVRPFTLSQLRNLLQRTGRIIENGFWIDKIKSKCYVIYENEDQAVETRHALHGVTWPVSNPKKLHVDFSTQGEFDKAKANEETDEAQSSTIPGTVEDWLREQDMKRERGDMEKPWERKSTREWDIGKNEKGKEKEKEKLRRDDKSVEKRRHHTPERSPEPAKKFKKKEEAPAKLLDDLFRKTKTTPCIYWLPLSADTIAVKEEQRRQHMAEHEKRLQELRRTHRRH